MARGAMAGMIGGAVASWSMQHMPQPNPRQGGQGNGSQSSQASQRQSQGKQRQQGQGDVEDVDATVKTAQAISRGFFDHELSEKEMNVAGPAVHYGYGTIMGGVYGALAEVWPTIDTGFGMPYAMALWLLGDEVAVPALHLGAPPTQTSPRTHADALASHICYGLTLDFVRRAVRIVI
jgi:uncharacterized membrane protein YagU involved in acid resistance